MGKLLDQIKKGDGHMDNKINARLRRDYSTMTTQNMF
jgi:hypothetical protein